MQTTSQTQPTGDTSAPSLRDRADVFVTVDLVALRIQVTVDRPERARAGQTYEFSRVSEASRGRITRLLEAHTWPTHLTSKAKKGLHSYYSTH